MPEQTPVILNHFSLIRFGPEYWSRPVADRAAWRAEWLAGLRQAGDVLHLYQVAGLEAGADLLAWSAVPAGEPAAAAAFFQRWAAAMRTLRPFADIPETFWGYTRPSQYTRVRSTQEMDPFAPARRTYLTLYPFVKTTEWYLKDREERREMMGGHIRVGKQYEDISQLLLYSFGLQDQEFVVVYEMDDSMRFLALVEELRGTEARRFTQRDTPLHAGIHQSEAALNAWL